MSADKYPSMISRQMEAIDCITVYYYCQELSEKEDKTAEKEDRYTGTVTWKVYFEFWKAGAGFPMLLLLIILIIGTQVNQSTWLIWQCVTSSSDAYQ